MTHLYRKLGNLGTKVRNKNKPEGSIAEAYLAEEAVIFLYLKDVESVISRRGRPIGKGEPFAMDLETITVAHTYILNNCGIISPYIQ